MAQPETGEVTRLLQAWNHGDKQALNEIVPLLYRDLRRLAAGCIRRERPDHTLQPTALVHEAYLRLADQGRVEIRDRAHFLAIAAKLMRQILVNHARYRRAVKRSGGCKVALEEAAGVIQPEGVDLVALDESLDQLARLDPRQGQIVEMRFFGGMTEDEIAEVLGVACITVKRDWRIARAVLYQRLAGGDDPSLP